MAAITATAALFLSVVGSSLISVASAPRHGSPLTLSGSPTTGTNLYDVSLVVPMGDPAPPGSVTVADTGPGTCTRRR